MECQISQGNSAGTGQYRSRSLLTLVSSGSVGDEIEIDLVESGAIERRFSYQSSKAARDATNRREIAFSNRNVSQIGDEVQYGGLVYPDIAIVEAVAVGQNWFVLSTSIGEVPAFVEAADRLFVELNHRQPLELQSLHDIYRPDAPPDRDPIPLTAPGKRIGDHYVEFSLRSLQVSLKPTSLIRRIRFEIPQKMILE